MNDYELWQNIITVQVPILSRALNTMSPFFMISFVGVGTYLVLSLLKFARRIF